eukprot:TRINITY_DN63339_c0_g1_i1.p1 TRINITY_DN63339_c0_g1~~TRINITY_DN63339_c0_g1_i1.p1  ORF type:complete len:496 (-),score=112.87 TRINITY_DN63339_c0_g1_i1:329-1816(-)
MASRSNNRLTIAGAAAGAAVLASTAAFMATPANPAPAVSGSSRTLRGTGAISANASSTTTTGSVAAIAGLGAAGLLASAVASGQKQRSGRSARLVRQQQQSTTTVAPPSTRGERADLTSKIPDCPKTIWNADNIDIDNLPPVTETAPLIIDANDFKDELAKAGSEYDWFVANRDKLMKQVQDHGALWLRNFTSTQDAAGFREFYEALQLNPCLDPIHTSGLRAMTEKKDAVYEAVNKPSLAQHFVGLHNESTFVKTATYGAFVCFEPASEGGGEFFVADGAKIINDMDKDVLKRVYEDKVRISVSNLDLNFLGSLPDGMREGTSKFLQDLILGVVAPKFEMDLEMVYGADQSNPYRLQAIEHAQSPINTHPVTGKPVWFCNLHNHSRYLRDRRPCTIPEVGMTDVYRGDLGTIRYDDVRHINEVCERNMVEMKMVKGDVIFLDNYRVLHGRKTFKGKRNHAVTWFESCGEQLKRDDSDSGKPDDFMNELVNKTLV